MKRDYILKLAVSAIIVAVPTAGCTSFLSKKPNSLTAADVSELTDVSELAGVSEQADVSKKANAGKKKAAKWAAKSEKYMVSGKSDKAVQYAERAVEADFQNSSYRSNLARGYIAQGRFVSAERTLQDVLDLGQSDPRTVVSLALLRISQGKTSSAINMLDSYRNILPDGDYGLALAVAGDSERAITILEQSARTVNNSQVRQNLALAYALNGQWNEARVMASQDLSGSQVNENIAKWAQYARPNAYETRVAGLLGVKPQQDSGQPSRLALNGSDINLAGNNELPAVGPAPVSLVDKIFDARGNNEKVASKNTILAPVSKLNVATAPAKTSRFIIEGKSNATPKSVANNLYTVQLGAFSSAQAAKSAWTKLTEEHVVLKPFQSVNSVVKSNGRSLYRLNAIGFGNKQNAVSVCNKVKSKGGSCVVRQDSKGTVTRLASSK